VDGGFAQLVRTRMMGRMGGERLYRGAATYNNVQHLAFRNNTVHQGHTQASRPHYIEAHTTAPPQSAVHTLATRPHSIAQRAPPPTGSP
jgi:hypothetical protein